MLNAPSADTNFRFRFISTFAGCGGSSLGYHWAGGKELLAVEWDDNAVETFKLNFPDIPVYHGDIAKLTVDECLRLAEVAPGELDVLDGSPPCQGFSTAGKRQMDDSRNQLFREYVRLLQGLKPKVFVMENVSGMVKGKMKLIFAEIMQELKGSGYQVKCQLMNAMYFNVPQSRERVIFIGIREDLGIEPTFPKAQSSPIVLRKALEGIDYRGIELTGNLAEIGEYAIPGEDFATTQIRLGAKRRKNFSTKKLNWDKPSNTLTKTVGAGLSGLVLPDENRFLSIAACKRITSFPDEYQFIGKYEQQWAHIGNSVPPRFMQAIAEHIRDNILNQK